MRALGYLYVARPLARWADRPSPIDSPPRRPKRTRTLARARPCLLAGLARTARADPRRTSRARAPTCGVRRYWDNNQLDSSIPSELGRLHLGSGLDAVYVARLLPPTSSARGCWRARPTRARPARARADPRRTSRARTRSGVRLPLAAAQVVVEQHARQRDPVGARQAGVDALLVRRAPARVYGRPPIDSPPLAQRRTRLLAHARASAVRPSPSPVSMRPRVRPPTPLWACPSLWRRYLNDNQLSDTLPSELGLLDRLYKLYVACPLA